MRRVDNQHPLALDRRQYAFTPAEIAEEFGVTRRTVYNWISSGRLEVHFRAGRRLYILDTAIERFEYNQVREAGWHNSYQFERMCEKAAMREEAGRLRGPVLILNAPRSKEDEEASRQWIEEFKAKQARAETAPHRTATAGRLPVGG